MGLAKAYLASKAGIVALPRCLEQRLEPAQPGAETFPDFFRDLGHLTGRTGDSKQATCQKQADNALEMAPFVAPNRRA